MSRIATAAIGLLTVALASTADDLVIQSFDGPGRVTFGETPGATGYRIEWASAPAGPWTSSWSALTNLPPTGGGTVTAYVPMLYRVVASVTSPPGMAFIPAGAFLMGNATNVLPNEGGSDELPQHAVYASAFYIDRTEVTKGLWDDVRAWAMAHGYAFAAGSAHASNHPVYNVNWYDVVKWCNARSERELLTPCYTSNGVPFRAGTYADVACTWSANGYRLPTEAEWEKAARGGVPGTRFPWADYTNMVSHARANYRGNTSLAYDLSDGYHPVYSTNATPYTSPAGAFAPNGYGLYDMAGNLWEWCWDYYSDAYYVSSPSTDPRGPPTGTTRAQRGGSWYFFSSGARISYRTAYSPLTDGYAIGFRCARGL